MLQLLTFFRQRSSISTPVATSSSGSPLPTFNLSDSLGISGLTTWLDADSIVAPNASQITTWSGRVNSNNATQSTLANRPRYVTSGFNSKPTVNFDGTDFMVFGNIAASTGQSYSKSVTFSLIDNASERNLLSSVNDHALYYQTGSPFVRFYHTGVDRVVSPIATEYNKPQHVFGTFLNGSGIVRLYVNGFLAGYTTGVGSINDTTLQLGSYGSDFEHLGSLSQASYYLSEVNPSGIWQTLSYLNQQYQFRPNFNPLTKNIVFEGDSLTEGYTMVGSGTATGDTYPGRVIAGLTALGYIASGTNLGRYNDELSNLETQIQTITTKLDALSHRNIACVWIGSNDLYTFTGTQVHTALISYCNKLRTMGYRVVVSTITPRSTYPTNWDTERLALNTLIRNNYQTYADKLVDLANVTELNTNIGSSPYYIDDVHFSAVGYQIVADNFITQIQTLL